MQSNLLIIFLSMQTTSMSTAAACQNPASSGKAEKNLELAGWSKDGAKGIPPSSPTQPVFDSSDAD